MLSLFKRIAEVPLSTLRLRGRGVGCSSAPAKTVEPGLPYTQPRILRGVPSFRRTYPPIFLFILCTEKGGSGPPPR